MGLAGRGARRLTLLPRTVEEGRAAWPMCPGGQQRRLDRAGGTASPGVEEEAVSVLPVIALAVVVLPSASAGPLAAVRGVA